MDVDARLFNSCVLVYEHISVHVVLILTRAFDRNNSWDIKSQAGAKETTYSQHVVLKVCVSLCMCVFLCENGGGIQTGVCMFV